MLKVGVKHYPFLRFHHNGPQVFMHRLTKAFDQEKIFKINSLLLPNYDFGLFSVTKAGVYDIPYFLRLDGLYIDNKNTKVNSNLENQKIFDSITNAKGIIFQSEYCKQITEKLYPNQINQPSIVINNGVPLDIFNPFGNNFRSKLNLHKNEKLLITSAHWRRHKRLQETIKLINILNEGNHDQYKLIILGKTNLQKIYSNNKNLIFAGEIEPHNLATWYRTADVYIHLAWIEPAGNTQNEAIGCGLPVVCSNNGGLKETVIRANAGLVSLTDNIFDYNFVDYYNPPEPNYSNLLRDVKYIFNNLDLFKSKIKYNEVDINLVAKNYEKFIKENFK